ncbi:SDR family oxidoreductase [Streptomyces sp. L7]
MRTALVGGSAGGIGHAIAERLAGAGDGVSDHRSATPDSLGAAAARLGGAVGRSTRPGEPTWPTPPRQRRRWKRSSTATAASTSSLLNAGRSTARWDPRPRRHTLAGGVRTAAARTAAAGPSGDAGHGEARLQAGRVRDVHRGTSAPARPGRVRGAAFRGHGRGQAALLEFATQGVTVNCVAPGATSTERRTQILANRARATHRSFDELDAQDVARIPARRTARPAEIAGAVAFLASDDAAYINGTVLTVDGGRTETI